jgi:FlaG/FlaF family flagellin (archaellin)
VSPVVGVALMVVITLLLASTIMIGLPDGGGIDVPTFADDSAGDTDVQTELIVAVRGEPGVDDEHQLRIQLEDGSNTVGNSLNQLTITYPDAVNASAVSGSDIDQVGIDRDGDGQLEEDAMVDLSGLSTSDDGSTLTITFGGNHDLEVGYWIVLDVSDLENPDTTGEYSVSVDVNGDVIKQGTLEID